jgi:hypothetical protein
LVAWAKTAAGSRRNRMRSDFIVASELHHELAKTQLACNYIMQLICV